MSEQYNLVPVDTLTDHFTADELKAVMPESTPEPIPDTIPDPEPSPGPIQEPEATPEPIEPSQTDGDTVSTLKPTVIPYDRFKEVNEKNKVLAAELAALKAQQPTQQPQVHQPTQQQQTTSQQPVDIAEKIEQLADTEVRGKLKIPNTVDVTDFSWQIENPSLYNKYLKETAKAEYRIEAEVNDIRSDNTKFISEFNSKPNADTLYNFAVQEINSMRNDDDPVKLAAADIMERAIMNASHGCASKKEISVLRKFTEQCEQRINSVNQAPQLGAISMPNTAPTSNPLDKAAGLPRASNLSGSKTAAMSWGQVEQLIRDGRSDEIPKEMLAQIDKRLLE